MKLIYIKSTITPKDYSVVREILKKERGEKLAPFIYKLNNLSHLEHYLNRENVNYEVYFQVENKQPKKSLKEQLIAGYKASAKNKKTQAELKDLGEASLTDVFTKLNKKTNKKG
ncbi:MAG: hypothetical protein MRERV_6c006 [Mycoplasmataceae bacterium RV_VA103A]|nr:MAG: hypothetical protein MRERV_6c006 [Mycoplasmataceae bacterium RV_VA103A]